jgi:hypothetical protein
MINKVAIDITKKVTRHNLFGMGSRNTTDHPGMINKKFWEELIAYFPLI